MPEPLSKDRVVAEFGFRLEINDRVRFTTEKPDGSKYELKGRVSGRRIHLKNGEEVEKYTVACSDGIERQVDGNRLIKVRRRNRRKKN